MFKEEDSVNFKQADSRFPSNKPKRPPFWSNIISWGGA